MPLSILLQQQEEATYDYVEDLPRGEQLVPEVEVERTSVPGLSPPVPPPTAPAPVETAGPSSTSQEPPEHIPGTSRDFLAVLDAVTALTEWMARAKVTLAQNHAMLLQIQSHLDLPPVGMIEPTQPTTCDQSAVSISAASLDMLAAVAAFQIHRRLHHHESEVVALPSLSFRSLPSGDTVILWLRGKVRVGSVIYYILFSFSFINCLLVLYRTV